MRKTVILCLLPLVGIGQRSWIWDATSDSEYIDAIKDINDSLTTGIIKSRYLKALKAMQKMTREKAYNYIKDMVDDESEMENYDVEL